MAHQGGWHKTDCECGKVGCWSNRVWLAQLVLKYKKAGKPLPANFPEKYRNIIVQDAAGKTVMESKDGEVPTVSAEVEKRLKPLPLPSQVVQQTIVTDQVPLRANWPWRALAKGVNAVQKEHGAPDAAMMDESVENERTLNEYFQRGWPDVMISPKLAFVIAFLCWLIPPALYWIPKWLAKKLKNFKWPWSKKKAEEAAAPLAAAESEAKA